jgi:hypothetical protein
MNEDQQRASAEETARGEMLKRVEAEELRLRTELRQKHDEDMARLEMQQRLKTEEAQLRAQMQAPPVIINNVIQNNVVAARPTLGIVVRALYFIFWGWWFGFAWLGLGILLCCTIIGIPLGLLMLAKTGDAFFLW